jgi:hypothetical protein
MKSMAILKFPAMVAFIKCDLQFVLLLSLGYFLGIKLI